MYPGTPVHSFWATHRSCQDLHQLGRIYCPVGKMSGLRRLLHTSSAQLNATASSASSSSNVSQSIPFAVARYVAKHLQSNPGSSSVEVPNPFLPQRRYRQSPSASATSSLEESSTSSSKHVVPPYISKRRQKQLFDFHDAESLPPTTLEKTIDQTASTTYGTDGSPGLTVSWTGDRLSKGDKSLYGGRKVQFRLHKHEREKHLRVKDTQDRMAGMDKRIDDWRSVSVLR